MPAARLKSHSSTPSGSGYSVYGQHPARGPGAPRAAIARYRPDRPGDRPTVFLSVQNDREWAVLCRDILGRPELIDDERFGPSTEHVEHNEIARREFERPLVASEDRGVREVRT